MKLKTAGWVRGTARVPRCWCMGQGRGAGGQAKGRAEKSLAREAAAELCTLEGEDFTREPRVSQLQPHQAWPTTCLYVACKLRMAFICLDD